MKKKIAGIIFTAIFVMAMMVSSAPGKSLTAIVSPSISKEDMKTLVEHVAEVVDQPGDVCLFVNGVTGAEVAKFTVRNSRRNDVRRRMQSNRKARSKLNKFATGEVNALQRLKIPEVLQTMSEIYPASEGNPIDVLIVGSLLYVETGPWTMQEGRYFNDTVRKAHYSVSPFGVAGLEGRLANYRIHWIIQDGFANDGQTEFHIKRAWHLYLKDLSAKVITLSHDVDGVFHRLAAGAEPIQRNYKPDDSTKMHMVLFVEKLAEEKRIKEELAEKERKEAQLQLEKEEKLKAIAEQKAKERQAATVPEVSVHQMEVSEKRLTLHQLKNVSGPLLGVSWNCQNADVDIYAKTPGGELVYYGRARTREADFWKDYTSSPREKLGYETISYKKSGNIDMSTLLIGINFYGGRCPNGIKGQVRVSTDGEKAFIRDFVIKAKRGNHGRGREALSRPGKVRAPNRNWKIFYGPDIVKTLDVITQK